MLSSSISLITPLVDCERNRKSGSKAINLSKLIAARFDVPRGFVINADAYRSHLWSSGARVMASGTASSDDRRTISRAILSADIPAEIWDAITEAYQRLSWQSGLEAPAVAVRPSALEDSSGAPGLPHAYLSRTGMAGVDELKTAVKEVWASLWSDEAAALRMANGLASEPAMAVIVQQMVEPQWAGTAQTADFTSGDPRHVHISLTSPIPARLTLDLRNFSVSSDGDPANQPPREIVRLLAEKMVLAENILGARVEAEWAFEDDRLWFIQAQPAANIPCYFPTDLNCELKRITTQPISFFSRSLLWTDEQQSLCDLRLINGYIYRCCTKTQPAETRSELTHWHKAAPALKARSETIIETDLSKPEYPGLVELLIRAADTSRQAVDWIRQADTISAGYADDLREIITSSGGGEVLAGRLLGGLDGPIIERDIRLQELGERFVTAEQAGQLNDRVWWQGYKNSVSEFSRDYGYSFRDSGETCDMSCWTSWIEDSQAVLRIIAAIARRGDESDLKTLHSSASQDAENATVEAVELVPAAKRKWVQRLVHTTRSWLVARNQCEQAVALAHTALRLVLLEFGCRLACEEVISEVTDIFHIGIDELYEIPMEPTNVDRASIAARIAERKHELWLEQRLDAPDNIPTTQPKPTCDAEDIIPASVIVSSGLVSGRVRIATSIAEAGEVECGDILVVRSVGSTWTPFLTTAGGFIVQSDDLYPGIESAIRAYGIPAVAGCAGILESVSDGQKIALDAATGTVWLRGYTYES
ncbi:MAG: PEP/pyruvate-binding domain-containing protein [Armatimonadota bacterium]|nr:hypothetical protein [bacterium]